MSPSALAFALVAAYFAFGALVIGLGAGRATRPGASSELWRTYATTFVIVAAVLVPAVVHPALFAFVVVIAAYRCAVELAEVQGGRLPARIRCALAAAIAAAVGLAAMQGPAESIVLLVATLVVLVLTAPLYARALVRPVERAQVWIVATAFPIAAAAHLSHLIHRPDGFLWLFLLYATVEVQDSMASLFGRLFGRRALLPRLSPRKTIEGALAGAAFGVATGTAVASVLLRQSPVVALSLAVLLVGAGLAGDIYTSALKRARGVKDFPPVHVLHGGVMDIYDSTLAAAVPLSIVLWLSDSIG